MCLQGVCERPLRTVLVYRFWPPTRLPGKNIGLFQTRGELQILWRFSNPMEVWRWADGRGRYNGSKEGSRQVSFRTRGNGHPVLFLDVLNCAIQITDAIFKPWESLNGGSQMGAEGHSSAICAQSSTIVRFCGRVGPFLRGTFVAK